ncbi:MAG TPA: Holliday junction resolvase RuvX [Anaerolineae bacterium]|nr:Holliday junction resolvase RuvX [Anaerolineae bacterium]
MRLQGRLLGLDVGDRRVGVAVCDAMGIVVTPLTVFRRGSRQADFARIAAIAARERATGIVVGLPLNMDGSEGRQARRARRFAEGLAASVDLPVVLWDERLSTFEAERRWAEAGRRSRQAEALDAMAAAVILQDYLDADRSPVQLPDAPTRTEKIQRKGAKTQRFCRDQD